MMRSKRLLATAFVGALVFAACSSDAETESSTTKAPSDTTDGSMDHSDESMDHGEDTEAQGIDDAGLAMLKNGQHQDMELVELSADDQAEIDRQLAITREVAEQYATLGVAIDAGFTRAGPFSPGLGIHYINPNSYAGGGLNPDGVVSDEDLRNPLVIIYDGTGRDAAVAGFMYYSMSKDEPEGFPGTNDFWHYHTNVCNQPAEDGLNAPLGADKDSITAEACAAVGGELMSETQWMVHVWSVPGFETTDAQGDVFAEVNPALKCADSTYFVMEERHYKDHPTNVCRSELEDATS
jgi:hypothetical protein